ncbi:unnamed protein product [Caenorhabditis nigoni]
MLHKITAGRNPSRKTNILSCCCYNPKIDWENRICLTYVTERESSAIQDLIPILEVLKSHNFRREICEVLTEAVASQTDMMDQITKLKKQAESVCETEAVFLNKDAEFEVSRRLYKECLDSAKDYFELEDSDSLVESSEKLVELAKKFKQAHEEVQTKNDDLNMQKEAIDEMLDPDDEVLLKSFTTKFFGILDMPFEEPSEDEPATKKGRMESEK